MTAGAQTTPEPPGLALIEPTPALHESWLESRAEWGLGAHQAGSGLWNADGLDVDRREDFAAWIERLRREADPTFRLPDGKVHATYWWIVEGETYLGAITLRHYLNDFLLEEGGHIGYGIRPSARGRGLATWALGRVLGEARALGLDRVLLTCDDDNLPSARTIERHGGCLEDVRPTPAGRKRRYWIGL